MTSVGGLIMYLITSAAVKAPGNALQNNFVKLGVIKGKTLNEIISACGQPSAVSALGDGRRLYLWQATGYHIALIFDENNICEGISSEISV